MIKRSAVWFFQSLVLAVLTVSLFSRARAQAPVEDPQTAFGEARAAYTAAIEAGDNASGLLAAKRVYELGLARFGRVNGNTAALAMNYGNMLVLAGGDNALAAEMFREADGIYAELSEKSLERVEALVALASVEETYDERVALIDAALNMHRAVLPEEDVAYARVQSVGGELLVEVTTDSSEAKKLLTAALDTLEEEFGEDSPGLVSTLVALGSIREGWAVSRKQLGYFDRAVEIARAAGSDDTEAVADVELQIAYQLGRQPDGYSHAMPYVTSARAKYDRLFGADHPKTAVATLTLGQAFISTGDYEQGVINVQKAIEFYADKPAYLPNLLRARQLLMSVYLTRDDDEQYTEQLMEVARLSEGSVPVEYLPIQRHAPDYPVEAFRCEGGDVFLLFTVDEEGRVRDPVVVDSRTSCANKEVFHEPALEAVRGWRYLPRFENGVAVSVRDVLTQIRFTLD